MEINCNMSIYLTKISEAVYSLSCITGCGLKPEAVRKVTVTLLELEQSTADFIVELSISADEAETCRKTFIRANEITVNYLEKIQSQGLNFEDVITALKLECETLNKEIDFA